MNDTKPSETKPSETKSKKMVDRNVAIALGIICILLIAVIAYFSVTGVSAQNSYNSLKNQNNQLQTWLSGNKTLLSQTQTWLVGNETLLGRTQTWLAGNITAYNNYVNDHHHTDEDYNSLSSQNTNLQDQVNGLTNTLSLGNSTIWVNDKTVSEPAGGLGIAWSDWTFSASYAGYVSIYVSSATVGAWTHVIYTSHGVSYNVQTNVGTSGTAYFPILPSSSITVGVGNGNLNSGATQTVTITYDY
jgi:hypothetical protein